jgi:hypothetical protein
MYKGRYGALSFITVGIFAIVGAGLPPSKRFSFFLASVILIVGSYVLYGLFQKLFVYLFTPYSLKNAASQNKLVDFVSIRAIFAGTSVSIALSIVLAALIVIGQIVAYKITYSGKFDRAVFEGMLNGNLVVSCIFILSVILTDLYSGYIAAYVAAKHEIVNGFASQIPLLAISVIEMFCGSLFLPEHHANIISPMMDNVFAVLAPFIGGIGGYIRMRRVQIHTGIVSGT